MKLAMIPLTIVALLVGIARADEKTAEQTSAPVPSSPPAAVDAAEAPVVEPAGPPRLIFYKGNATSNFNGLVNTWKEQGLIVDRGIQSDPGLSSNKTAVLTIQNVRAEDHERLTSALREISKLKIPEWRLGVSGPRSRDFGVGFGQGRPQSNDLSARLDLNESTDGVVAKQAIDILNRAGIPTVALRRPSISLWIIKSDMSSVSAVAAVELKNLMKDIGLTDVNNAVPYVSSDVIFPRDVSLQYSPENASKVLKWLKEQNLVLGVTAADPSNPAYILRLLKIIKEAAPSEPFVERSVRWEWAAEAVEPSEMRISRTLGEVETWRGEARPRAQKTLSTSALQVTAAPGQVAILHAFGLPKESLAASGDLGMAIQTSKTNHYLALLVVENRAVESDPATPYVNPESPPKLVPPGVVSPIVQVEREHGSGSSQAGVGPLIETAAARESNSATEAAAENRCRIIIAGDGGATSQVDKEKIKKLVSEGVLKQVDSLAHAPDVADLMFQPNLDGPVPSSFNPRPELSTTAIHPKWDEALRELSRRPVETEIRIRFFGPGNLGWSFTPKADVTVFVPVDSTHKLSETITSACEKVGLTVNAQQNHPFFGAQSIPKGKELYAVYANEAGSPTAILQSTEDLVDVRLILDEGSGLRGTFGRTPTVLERASILTYQNAPKDAGGRRVVGVLVTPEEGRLLRAAERAGRLEAVRRDPGDTTPPVETAPLATALLADAGETLRSKSLPSPPVPNLKVIRLQNAQAGPMSSLLAQVVRKEGFTAVADERTNSLVITSPDEETFLVAEALLAKLDEDTPARGAADPYAGRASDGPTPTAIPLVDLQRTYAQAEEAAAKQSRQLREFIAKRPVALRDKRFAEQQQQQRERLAKAVKEAFAARQAQLAAELAELQRRVEAAQRSLDLRNRAADEIIARRVEDLLNPELKWDEPQVAGEMVPAARPTESSPLTLPAPPVMPGSARYPVVPSGPGSMRPSAAGPTPAGRTTRTIPLGRLSLDETNQLLSQIQATVPGSDAGITSDSSGSKLRIDATDRELAALQPLIELATQTANDRWKQTELQLLTGIWESQDGLDGGMGMGMGGYGGLGGDDMAAMSGDPPPRLVIDGEYAALYVKNERRRLWTITVDFSPKSWTRVAFLPLDDQPGMQGSFDAREKSLTVVSSGEEGAKIVRYDRSIAAVPPDWSQQMRDAAEKKGKSTAFDPLAAMPNVADEFAARPRIDLASTAPNGEADVFSKMTGLWANAGQMGGMGMGMGMEGSLGGGFDEMGRRSPTFLVIHSDRAALFEKNERKRLWSISVMQVSETEARLDFAALDDEPGMQGTYTLKSGSLSAVSSSEQGPRIVQYHRVAPVIPPEWAQVMSHPSREDVQRLFENREPEPQRSKTGEPSVSQPVRRQPSDYLARLEKYRPAQSEYDSLLQTVGADHPRARKFLRERSHELDAIDVLKSEFELDVDEAMRRRSLAREQAVQAEERFTYTRRQVEKGTASQTLMEQERLARDSARAELESAEKRLELFESSRAKLFPPRGDSGALPTYAPPATGAAPPGPAAPPDAAKMQIPSPATQPSVGEKPSEPNPPTEPPQAAAPPATP